MSMEAAIRIGEAVWPVLVLMVFVGVLLETWFGGDYLSGGRE